MNLFIDISRLGAGVCAALVVLSGTSVCAQQADAAVRTAERRQEFESTLALFLARDYTRAEQALFKANRQPQNTLDADLESARKLIQMAAVLRQRYDVQASLEASYRALAILKEGEERRSAGATLRRRAQLQELTGFVAERLLREPAVAQQAYENALQIDPASVAAKGGLERIAAAKNAKERTARLIGKN